MCSSFIIVSRRLEWQSGASCDLIFCGNIFKWSCWKFGSIWHILLRHSCRSCLIRRRGFCRCFRVPLIFSVYVQLLWRLFSWFNESVRGRGLLVRYVFWWRGFVSCTISGRWSYKIHLLSHDKRNQECELLTGHTEEKQPDPAHCRI